MTLTGKLYDTSFNLLANTQVEFTSNGGDGQKPVVATSDGSGVFTATLGAGNWTPDGDKVVVATEISND